MADIYRLKERGYLREGYYADVVELRLNAPWEITSSSLLYKCGWAPVVGERLSAKVKRTFVNGNLVFQEDVFMSDAKGSRLFFEKSR